MRIGIGNPTQAEGWELQAIASSVIGGTSLFGAVGSVHGPLIGSFILTTINNGANLLNLNPFWQRIITGFLIIIVVYFDTLRSGSGDLEGEFLAVGEPTWASIDRDRDQADRSGGDPAKAALHGGAHACRSGSARSGQTKPPPDAVVAAAVEGAAAIGYRHFDCASVYGNEDVVGAALDQVMRGGIDRKDLWITSKALERHACA